MKLAIKIINGLPTLTIGGVQITNVRNVSLHIDAGHIPTATFEVELDKAEIEIGLNAKLDVETKSLLALLDMGEIEQIMSKRRYTVTAMDVDDDTDGLRIEQDLED